MAEKAKGEKVEQKASKVDISGLSLEELRALAEEVQERLAVVEEESRRDAFAKMQELAASVGLSPQALLKHFGGGESSKVKAKYRNPANPEETWSGRGRKPAWLQDWLDAGKDLKDLEA